MARPGTVRRRRDAGGPGAQRSGGLRGADAAHRPRLEVLPADGGVIALRAAAWIHLGGPPPDVLDVHVPRPLRARFGVVRYRCARTSGLDVDAIGGVPTTSLLTTACDLAREVSALEDSGDDDGARLARESLRAVLEHVRPDAVRGRLLSAARARGRRALAVVDALAPAAGLSPWR
ncbi:hypothetical protein [Litorihabitans aurantiacus]|uniref:Uncharacterized protein n=1 Tax=Litorihabitans aurantiacus TaxID=1930061 RepID=A0AA38CNN1_9MICO|nr:hypothetical protein [Litorihabitans aurantiacus]GMA31373.1 hypothetical protein GCM10025875_13650 [Litorihabitans aurantiacus]